MDKNVIASIIKEVSGRADDRFTQDILKSCAERLLEDDFDDYELMPGCLAVIAQSRRLGVIERRRLNGVAHHLEVLRNEKYAGEELREKLGTAIAG